MISLSLVTPLFNEEKNLPKLFSALEEYRNTQTDFLLEFVFINDGSIDGTEELLQDFAAKHSEYTKVISYPENEGRGYALRRGMLEATGDWRLVLDADLAAPLSEAKKLIPCIESGCDIIIGSRSIRGAQVETPPSHLRFILGVGFIVLARICTDVRVSDFSCGFKCFSKQAAEMILPQTKINRWAHDAENLYLAKKFGLKVCEIPLTWRNGPGTTVRIGSAVVQSLIDLVRIRLIHR